MSNIGEFVKSFGADWVTKMSGIVSVFLMMAGAIMGSSPPARWTWIVAILCVIYAAYNVWQTERVKYNAETATRKKLEAELQAAALKYAALEAAKKDDPAAARLKEKSETEVRINWSKLMNEEQRDVIRVVDLHGHLSASRVMYELRNRGVKLEDDRDVHFARSKAPAILVYDNSTGDYSIRPENKIAVAELLSKDERYRTHFPA
jgi:hypothetical protein